MNENLENEATIQPEETAQEHETLSRPDGQDAAAQEQPPAMEAAAEKTEEGDSGKDDAQEHTGKEAEDPRQHDAALARVTQRAAEAELPPRPWRASARKSCPMWCGYATQRR